MKYTRKLKLGPPKPPSIVNAMTVDVEDYFQVSAFESDVERAAWDRYPSRVQRNTMRLLELFADHDLRATFFVLGWVAERFPELVQTIQAAGHEVASHSHLHRLVYDMSPGEFREDVRRSREVLQQAIGERVRIYRAPSFSITRKSLWALEVLVEEGFEIDSSIFPIRHDRYGIPDADRSIHQIVTPSGPIWEVPGTVVRRFGCNLPISGGGYLRLLPLAWTLKWLRQINQRESRGFMFYVHPWEIDPQQPRVHSGSFLSRWRHYQNLDTCEAKVLSLVDAFQFDTLSAMVRNVARSSGHAPPALDRPVDDHKPRGDSKRPNADLLPGTLRLPDESGGSIVS